MPRYLFALALCLAVVVPVQAQVYTIQPRPMRVENKPRGSFSLSFRYGGSTNVRFEDVGTIASTLDIGDTTSSVERNYNDGFVGLASGTRTATGETDRWAYGYRLQEQANGDLAFHQYSTESTGLDLNIDSGALAGVDMQYDFVVGVWGSKVTDKVWSFTWGGTLGAVFSPINTKSRQQIKANLITVTDLYSLNGATLPETLPYTAPSSGTISGTDSNGNSVSYPIDTTIILGSTPRFRSAPTTTLDGADVDGFWQVKGALYSLRVGPWLRWHFGSRLSLRASGGLSFAYAGVKMRYDEFLLKDFVDIRSNEILRGGQSTEPDDAVRFGTFGSLDAEWWISDRTSFFAGLTYEDTGKDLEIIADNDDVIPDRRAVVELPSGTGFRFGVTVLF